jgi:rubrerythrin
MEKKDEGGAADLVASVLAARSHYECLGLAEELIEDMRRVRRHYRERARRVHPDKCRHPDAPRAFRALTQALECLVDPQSQATYLSSLLRSKRSSSTSSFTSSSRSFTSSSSSSSTSSDWFRAGPKASFRQSEFAHAYAEAMHAARRRAREHKHHQQQQQQQEEQQKKRKATEEEKEEEEEEEPKQRKRPESFEAKKRPRTSRSVPFDYADINASSNSTGRPPRPTPQAEPRGQPDGGGGARGRHTAEKKVDEEVEELRRAKEKASEQTSTKKKKNGGGRGEEEKLVCAECGRRFPSQATYDRHQLVGAFNHRYRRKASSSSSTPMQH